eukprot:Em0015g452a
MCSAINVTNDAWSQAQLGLKFGGLGLRSLTHHAAAAFIASLSFFGFGKADNIHLKQAVAMFNTQVSPFNAITVNSALESPIHQKVLSGLIQAQHFHILLESSSPANRARLLSVAAPHASSWLSVVPSPGLGLHLESNEFQMAIRWWLGGKPAALDLTITSPLCSVILGESCYQAGVAALAAETRKLHSNGPKCQELGWSCIPLAVETYGNWGKQAHDTFSRLTSFLAIHQSSPKAVVVAEIYGLLNVVLVAIETSGVFGPRTTEFLKELGLRLRQVSGEANSFAYLTQRLSIAVQRGNAASVLGTIKMGSEEEEFLVKNCYIV